MADEKERWPTALIIAGVPMLGYFSAYRFEQGYLELFSVPDVLIRVSLELAISNALSLLAVFLGFFGFVNGAFMVFPNAFGHPHYLVRRIVYMHVFLLVLVALLVRAYGWQWVALGFTVALVVLIDVILFPHIFFGPRDRPWYERVEDSEKRHPIKNIHRSMAERFGTTAYFTALVIAVVVYFGAYLGGTGTARLTRYFHIAPSTQQVLIRRYGDTAILKGIDVERKTILNTLSVLTPEDLSTLTFERVLVGTVVVEEPRRTTEADAEPAAAPEELQPDKPTDAANAAAAPKELTDSP